jgi:uncharacterized membrane protein YkvA (DUF1232 family)
VSVWDVVIGIALGVLGAWILLIVALVIVRPRGVLLRTALRLLPDVLALVRRLAADDGLPRGVRVRLWLLLGYLVLPFDLVPDFVPVLGYADDAIVVIAVLRGVVRRAGVEAVRRHWHGTEDGFAALCRLTGLDGERERGGDTPAEVDVAGEVDLAEPVLDQDPAPGDPGEQRRGQRKRGGRRTG